MSDTEFLIVGGGISGLTTAFTLQQAGKQVLLLEGKAQVGGNIQSRNNDGWLVEEGPNSLLVNRQQVLDLFDDLGLQSEVVEASQVSKNRYIFREGRLMALPGSPFSFLRTRLFTLKDKLRLFKEPFISRADEEETIAQFVTRRLGKGFYDYAINPFVSGVYAGDPHVLSARAATRKVYALEEKHGSLVRGALSMVLGFDRPEGRVRGKMLSFRSGMEALPRALAASLGPNFKTSQHVESLDREGEAWKVCTTNGTYLAKHVVLSCTARESARLLSPFHEVQDLENLDYVPIAVMHLGFKKSDLLHSLNGFGCLVPRKEGIKLLGALFSSSMFPGRTPNDDEALITCFLGGATFRDVCHLDSDAVYQQVLKDLDLLLGVKGEPVFQNVVRYDRSIPQYTLGHLDRMEKVQKRIALLPHLSTRANWHGGISVSDCILNAINHGRQLSS